MVPGPAAAPARASFIGAASCCQAKTNGWAACLAEMATSIATSHSSDGISLG